ncbi:hypothetical protein NL676_022853 [Syzygium grande]|nr:hypothetical protein NL676_022853 [Syzygium grande]
MTIEYELMQHIKSARTPKEAWDNLATLFARSNDAKLQRLENELLSMSQQNMTVSQYFSKVKSICDEISKLDPTNAISETRMRTIIIHGLKPEYNGIITTARGWATHSTLTDLESILANQETLDSQMSKISIKREESALFNDKRGFKGQRRTGANNKDGKSRKSYVEWQSNQLVKNGKSLQERRVFKQGEPGGAMAKDVVDDVTSTARRATLPEILERRKLKEMSQHYRRRMISMKIRNGISKCLLQWWYLTSSLPLPQSSQTMRWH